MRTRIGLLVFAFGLMAVVFGFPGTALAYLVNFENTGLSEGSNEADTVPLTTQIPGLTFSGARIIQTGYPESAFTPGDTVLGGSFGSYFISDLDYPPNANENPIGIRFATPVSNVSIAVADIDEQEAVKGEAFDINNILLQTITFHSGDAGTGNQSVKLFAFDASNVSRLVFTPYPSSDGGIGWGLDNLSYNTPAPVPIPSTMLLLGSGLVGLIGFRRKFRK
jgi:hypothetical protein